MFRQSVYHKRRGVLYNEWLLGASDFPPVRPPKPYRPSRKILLSVAGVMAMSILNIPGRWLFAPQNLVGITGDVHQAPGTVATPTDSPGQGTYTSTQSVTLSDSTSGSTICYTIDGSTPGAATPGTCNSSPTTTYSGAISVSATTTIKAIGTKSGLINSGVLTSVYTINAGSIGTPVINTAGANYNAATCTGHPTCTITISSTTAGDFLFFAARRATTEVIASATGCGGAFTLLQTAIGNTQQTAMWGRANVSGGCTSFTITWTSPTTGNWDVEVYTVQMTATSVTVDAGTTGTSSTGTTPSAGPITTTNANDFWFFTSSKASTWDNVCPAGWTNLGTSATHTPCYKVTTSTGTDSCQVTKGASGAWSAAIFAVVGF